MMTMRQYVPLSYVCTVFEYYLLYTIVVSYRYIRLFGAFSPFLQNVPMATLKTTYLIVYNVCQALGWMYVLYKGIIGSIEESSLAGCAIAAGSSVGTCFFGAMTMPTTFKC